MYGLKHLNNNNKKNKSKVSSSIRAAITKSYRLSGINSKYVFLIVLEAGTSKFKVPADSASGED